MEAQPCSSSLTPSPTPGRSLCFESQTLIWGTLHKVRLNLVSTYSVPTAGKGILKEAEEKALGGIEAWFGFKAVCCRYNEQ